MKKGVLMFCLAFSIHASAQDNCKAIAHKYGEDSILVFVYSEPIMPYIVIAQVKESDGGKMLRQSFAGVTSSNAVGIAKEIEKCIKIANKRTQKDHLQQYDALIITDGQSCQLIKFK